MQDEEKELTRSDSDILKQPKPVYKMLERLPYELVEIIVSHVVDIEDLRSLARVNRLFQELTEPRIYAHVLIRKGSQAEILNRAVKSRPIRATWIRNLQNACQLDSILGLAQLLEILRDMTGLENLLVETPDCNSSLPEDRTPWITNQNFYSDVFGEAVQPSSNILPRLLSCTLHFIDGTRSLYPLAHHSVIFLHPTLTSLTISCASIGPPPSLSPLLLPPERTHTTPLTSLNLIECDIHPEGLYRLVQLPRQLLSLSLTAAAHHGFYSVDRRYLGLNRLGVLHPVAASQPQLNHLTIALLHAQGDHLFSIPPLDLSRFAKLHSVEYVNIHVANANYTPASNPQLNYCPLVHRAGPRDNTGGPDTTTLVYSDIDPPLWRAGISFFKCAFRNKVSHGIEHLRSLKLILRDEGLTLQEDMQAGMAHLSPALRLRVMRARDRRKERVEQVRRWVRELGELGARPEVGIRVVVEWVMPSGKTIPPYLVGEYVPVITPEYDNRVRV